MNSRGSNTTPRSAPCSSSRRLSSISPRQAGVSGTWNLPLSPGPSRGRPRETSSVERRDSGSISSSSRSRERRSSSPEPSARLISRAIDARPRRESQWRRPQRFAARTEGTATVTPCAVRRSAVQLPAPTGFGSGISHRCFAPARMNRKSLPNVIRLAPLPSQSRASSIEPEVMPNGIDAAFALR